MITLGSGTSVVSSTQFTTSLATKVNKGELVINAADYATVQLALNAASAAGGGVVYLGPGVTTFSSPITVPTLVRLVGAGQDTTRLRWSALTGDAITLNGTYAGLENLTVEVSGANPNSGALLVLGSGAYSVVRDVHVGGGYDNVRGDNAYGWVLDNCYFTTPARYSCFLRSVTNPDRGDSTIRSCTFDTGTQSVGTAIRYESGGGLKIVATKILHHAYGLDLQVSDGSATSIMTVTGSSIENQATACVRLGRAGTTGTFTEVMFSGCQLNGTFGTSTTTAFTIGAGVNDVAITGCTLKGLSGQTAIAVDNTQRVTVTGNSFHGWSTAVAKGSAAPQVAVAVNNYNAVSIPLQDDTPSNLSLPGRSLRNHRVLVSTTSATTYTNLYRVEFNNYRGAQLALTIEGLLGSVGNATRHVRLLAKRETGNVAVTTISDTAAGAACDVQFDVTTTAGSVLIGVRRNSAAGGTQLDATVTLDVEGGARLVALL